IATRVPARRRVLIGALRNPNASTSWQSVAVLPAPPPVVPVASSKSTHRATGCARIALGLRSPDPRTLHSPRMRNAGVTGVLARASPVPPGRVRSSRRIRDTPCARRAPPSPARLLGPAAGRSEREVVRNDLDDIRDGTVAQGDAWLQSNPSAYAAW